MTRKGEYPTRQEDTEEEPQNLYVNSAQILANPWIIHGFKKKKRAKKQKAKKLRKKAEILTAFHNKENEVKKQ